MRLPQVLLWLLAFVTTIHAFTIPASLDSFTEASQSLFKRKGGGGGGKGGGSGSSGGSSSGGSSGGASGGRGSTSSNSGGRTTTGSGTPKTYGGAYAGGASAPYSAGSTQRFSSGRSVTPYFLGGAALGFFPGVWLYGAYAYGYGHPYYYHNNTSNQDMNVTATCLCEQYQECGCDDNNSTDYMNNVANNQSVSKLATVNGTQQLFINGTLPNGTTADGGDDDPYDSGVARAVVEMSGFWVVIVGVICTVWSL